MRILHIATHLNIGGIGKYIVNLSAALKRNGHEVFVASSGGELINELEESGASHIALDIKTKSELSPKLLKAAFRLKNIVKEKKIDLIHAHTRVTQVSAALTSFLIKVPYVATFHGYFKKRLGRVLFPAYGDKAIAISDAVKRHLIDDLRLNENKVALIYTGIDESHFMEAISPERKGELRAKYAANKGPVVGNIGRLSPVKGQEILVKSAKILTKEFDGLNFLLVGDGPDEKRLKKLVFELKLDRNVFFIKSVEDTRDILSIMDVFVLPSVKEGLGLSLIEAMASGKACVASKIGGIENVIDNGEDGILVEVNNRELMARAISRILKDEDLKNTLGFNARKKVKARFTLDKMAKKMEDLYRSVLKASLRPR